MIIKGNRHSNGKKLAAYLLDGGRHGERVASPELHGFGLYPDDISKAFCSLDAIASGKGIENPLFHIQIRLPKGEQLTREQWDITIARTLKTAGLEGQPYAEVFHTDEKTGEIHCHLGVSLIDEQTHKAKAVPFYKFRFKALARKLEVEFDLTRVRNHRDGAIKYGATRKEEQQAQRLGFKKEAVREIIRQCWDASLSTGPQCGHAFDDALADAGLILAQADHCPYVVIDITGGIHAIGKRILDVSPAGMAERLSDLDRENIPTIAQAKEFMLDLPRDLVDKLTRELAEIQKQIEAAEEYARRDPAREEIQWLDKVAQAAIEKEKVERQFVEPRPAPAAPAREETRGAAHREITTPESEKLAAIIAEGQKRQAAEQERQAAQEQPKPKRTAPPISKTDGGIRLAYSLTGTGQEFADAVEDRGLIASRVNEADADRLNRWERQRLKELEALAPARAGSWMAQTGGFDNLTPELQEKAEASYGKWNGDKQRYGLHNYVDFVQTHEAERREGGKQQKRPYEGFE